LMQHLAKHRKLNAQDIERLKEMVDKQ